MVDCDDVLERRYVVGKILENRGELAVITGLGSPTYDVAAAGDHPRNYYLWGAMGGAVSVGLGLALARPELDVLVVTGDGEMLMGMGSLSTVGVKSPANLAILVLDNSMYGETGRQPSHTASGVDLSIVARGCNIANAWSVSTPAQLDEVCQPFLQRGSPRFLLARVKDEQPERVMPTRDAVENKISFRRETRGA